MYKKQEDTKLKGTGITRAKNSPSNRLPSNPVERAEEEFGDPRFIDSPCDDPHDNIEASHPEHGDQLEADRSLGDPAPADTAHNGHVPEVMEPSLYPTL